MRISKFTIFFSLYIILSSLFMQEVWAAWKAIFGVRILTIFFVVLCLLAISAILYTNIKLQLDIKRVALICAICILGFIFAWRQPYFAEKAHVLEFGVLGWLVMRDLSKKSKSLLKDLLFAFIFVSFIGVLEESYQKLLPWRVCEIRDMVTDSLSGLLGIALWLLSLAPARLFAFIRPL